jgi:hypothetical protein
MPTYSAADIVGKTLIAKEIVPIYSLPNAAVKENLIGSIDPGESLGVVYSWVGGTDGKPLYWQFKGSAGKFYYAMHKAGRFDVRALQDQGVLTTEERLEAENPKSGFDKALSTIKTIAIIAAAAFVGKSYLDSK